MSKAEKIQPSVGKAATTGLVWLLMQSLSGRGMMLISQLILAKLLVPEDFGIVGLAYTITTVFGIVTNVGVDSVLQQRRTKMKYWATQAFYISMFFAVLTAIAMAVYAPIGAQIYNNEHIIPIVWIIALSVPLTALSLVPQVNLQSQLRFKFMASYNTGQNLVTNLSTILLACFGFGALSFVLPLPFLALIRAIVFWRIAPIPLRPLHLVRGWLRLVKRGATVLGGTISTTLISQGDYIVLGLFAPVSVIGAYFFAFKLAIQPIKLLGGNFTGVLFPALTAMQNDPTRQRDAAFKTSNVLALLVFPLYMLQASVADPAVTFLFGERWVDAIPFIQILSMGLCFDAPAWAAGSLLNARGEFRRKSLYHAASAIVFYVLVGLGALLGAAKGVAVMVAIYYVIHVITYSLFVFVHEGINVRRVLFSLFMPFILSVASIGPAYGLAQLPFLKDYLIGQIVITSVVGGCLYLLAARLFLPDLFNEVQRRIRDFLRRKRKTSS